MLLCYAIHCLFRNYRKKFEGSGSVMRAKTSPNSARHDGASVDDEEFAVASSVVSELEAKPVMIRPGSISSMNSRSPKPHRASSPLTK